MRDCISRQAIEEIKEIMTDINGNSVYAARMSDIRALSSGTRMGHWIVGKTRMDGFTCSECNKQYIVYRMAYNYCPNCGADMRDTVFSCASGNLKTNDFVQRCVDVLDKIEEEK